jgi:hypothetical protein
MKKIVLVLMLASFALASGLQAADTTMPCGKDKAACTEKKKEACPMKDTCPMAGKTEKTTCPKAGDDAKGCPMAKEKDTAKK